MLALMPALCTCGADKRFGDSKGNVGFEPTLPNAVPQHFASAEKLTLRDRPKADLCSVVSVRLLCRSNFVSDFALLAKDNTASELASTK